MDGSFDTHISLVTSSQRRESGTPLVATLFGPGELSSSSAIRRPVWLRT
jgi:hypothetical protein